MTDWKGHIRDLLSEKPGWAERDRRHVSAPLTIHHDVPRRQEQTMLVQTIDPNAVHDCVSRGDPCLRLDVRTPIEHRALHAEGVELMPLAALDIEAIRRRSSGHPVYVFCHSGSRAKQAVERLAAAGIAGCHVVEGGTQAWADAGLPVVRGPKAVSLERQVRIAAGSLVLLGIGLGIWVHPGFLGLTAFVGAGLVFAGVTDRCGMALMLAKMPWNRNASNRPTACTRT